MRSLTHVGFVALLLMAWALGAASPAIADEAAPEPAAQTASPRPRLTREPRGRELLVLELEELPGFTQNPRDIRQQLLESARTGAYARATPFPGAIARWEGFKAHLSRCYGLDFGLFHSSLGYVSTGTVPGGLQASAAGVFGFIGTWELVGRGTSMPGGLGWQIRDVHPYGASSPFLFGLEIGSVYPAAVLYGPEYRLYPTVLYWEQQLIVDRLAFRFGRQEALGVHDTLSVKSPLDGFNKFGIAVNPTVPWNPSGFSFTAHARPTTDTYILVGVYDGNGFFDVWGWDSFWDTAEYVKIAELGFDRGVLCPKHRPVCIGPVKLLDAHVLAWHADRRPGQGLAEGWGITATAEGEIGRFRPFLRWGMGRGVDGPAPVTIQDWAAAGVSIKGIGRWKDDVVGVALGWGGIRSDSRSATGRSWQGSGELFWRMQVFEGFQVTPSVQLIANPANNAREDVLVLFGLRTRIDFELGRSHCGREDMR